MKHPPNAILLMVLLALALPAVSQSTAPPPAPAQTLKDNYYPRLVKIVLPEVPPEVSRAMGAMVQLLIHVGVDGRVSDVEVLHSTEGASKPVLAAVNQWTFEPLVKSGQPAASSVRVFIPLNMPASPYQSKEDQLRSLVQASSENALAPAEKLAVLEQQYEGDTVFQLPTLTKVAFEAGDYNKARYYALQCLKADATPTGPDGSLESGNGTYFGNLVLGRLAMRDGNVEEAKKRLLAAASTKGSPQLDSFGPNTTLAKELLEKGERDTVLQFFELCRTFWKNDRGQLDAWSAQVRAGKIPDFGANQLY